MNDDDLQHFDVTLAAEPAVAEAYRQTGDDQALHAAMVATVSKYLASDGKAVRLGTVAVEVTDSGGPLLQVRVTGQAETATGDDRLRTYDIEPDPSIFAGFMLTKDPRLLKRDVVDKVEGLLSADGLQMAEGPLVMETSPMGQDFTRVTVAVRPATTAEAAHLMLQATASEGWVTTASPAELQPGDQVRVLYAPRGGHQRIVAQGEFHRIGLWPGTTDVMGMKLTPITDGEHLDDEAKLHAMSWHEHVQWHKDEGHPPEATCRPPWEIKPGSVVQVRR